MSRCRALFSALALLLLALAACDVPVVETAGTPCLAFDTPVVAFGGVPVGASASVPIVLRSCGDAPVLVTALAVDGAAYTLGAPDLPRLVAPGGSLELDVTYAPTAVGDVPDDGLVHVTTSEPSGDATALLSGRGVASGPCLVPVLTADAPLDTVVGDVVTVSAVGSVSSGSLTAYFWSGVGPGPSFLASDKTVSMDSPGVVEVELRMIDIDGLWSCQPARLAFVVHPDAE